MKKLLLVLAVLAVAAVDKPQWAQPVEKPGLPNLHQVAPKLYRGAQPTEEGFRQLKAMGIKTVVNLRGFHTDDGKLNGLHAEHIHFQTWHPENEDIVKFLRILSDTNAAPVFVHCQHGADRTGTMCAIYRIAVQGWTKDQAIEEMIKGGFGYHAVWKNLIQYIRELDVDTIKKQAGLKK